MNRRRFLGNSAAAAALPVSTGAAPAPPKKAQLKLAMKHVSADADLRVLSAFGVKHILGDMPSPKFDETWSVEALTKYRGRVESHGIRLEMVALPLSAVAVERSENPNIMLGKSPERDREIDNICQMIRNLARAGIPAAKYNLTLLGVVRTESSKGRGGALYSTFDYSKLNKNEPPGPAGQVNAEQTWDRITYFLKRVIPVAEEYKVKMACHPHDPAMPKDRPWRGVIRVLDTPEGFKRLIQIMPSDYHGLLLCQGTMSESLKNPAREILEVIRYFGSRKKIFAVDFRNITGGYLNFQETFPDNGDVNMLEALRVYRDVGYDGMFFPDHVPRIEGDIRSRQGFAYALGYMQAIIQMVNEGRA
jgi:mannonate dehydratase